MSKKTLLTGIKPTGRLHLGNYFSVIKPVMDAKNSYDTYFFLADLHALTKTPTSDKTRTEVRELMIDLIALGLDHKAITLYKQSHIKEIPELKWILECLVTVPYLMRAHAYKDAEAKGEEITGGTFDYPVLMAADILILQPDLVPVGKDQKQHIEYARDMAQKFNNQYDTEYLKLPKELIDENVQTIPGTDGEKMSKSYNNVIPVFSTREELTKIVMSIPSDSTPVDQPKDTETNIISKIHTLVLDEEDKLTLKTQYETPGLSYKVAKENLLECVWNYFAEARERRAKLEKNFKAVEKAYAKGSKKVSKVAAQHMEEIRELVGYGN
jgi:tryptophanyl-tRNA synthetase